MTTKKEKKELRKAKREERKNMKKLRHETFNKIIAAAKDLDLKFDLDTPDPDFADAFNEIWPVLCPTLEYAKVIRVTGPKADKVLSIILDLGNRISTGEATENEKVMFSSYLDSYWNIVEMTLDIIKTFTSESIDEVIDKVLEIGDWLTDNEDN